VDRAGFLGQHAPVGAELERHDDPGDDTHAKGRGKDLDPEIEQAAADGIVGGEPHPLHCREPPRQPDREAGKMMCDDKAGGMDGP
jgi:hypothetical protein